MGVRVRYAPSPTGFQHIGGVRTALFNYLLSRARGGAFILRIEDTDRERYSPDALTDIYDTFAWLGIEWDEGPDGGGAHGPYFQSERTEIYRRYADALVDSGHGYRCYCSPERLEKLRAEQAEKGLPQGYDRRCRSLSADERQRLERDGTPSVVRLTIPEHGSTGFHDELLGDIERANRDINPDPILLKTDGLPTYHLANVIDDHLMEITHILRAQEWIPTAPIHILLYRAFGWNPPLFCHLPMVMGSDGQKLSKRHGSTSIREFRREGYLPEAVINMIALLGWSYDDTREFFTLGELESLFSLDRLNKAPAVFDYKKLAWFNGAYIRMKTDEELKDLILPYLIENGLVEDPPTAEQSRVLSGCVPLVKERLRVLSEAPELVRFIYRGAGEYGPEDLVPKKLDRERTKSALMETMALLEDFHAHTDEQNEQRFRDLAARLEIKLGDLLMPLRVALTGSRVSLPLFESIGLVGADEARRRVGRALEIIGKE